MNKCFRLKNKQIMTGTSNESAKDLEKLFKIIKFAMLTTVNEDGTLHSR